MRISKTLPNSISSHLAPAFAVLAGLLLAGGLAAQTWRGPVSLGVEVTDQAGVPVPEAEVRLEYAEVEPYVGPPPALTDAAGRLEVFGLAEGLWRVQVGRQGFSPYLVVLRLDAGKKKVLITAGPLRDATAPPLEVAFVKSEAPGAARERVAEAGKKKGKRDRGDKHKDRGGRRISEAEPAAEPAPAPQPRIRPVPPPAPEPATPEPQPAAPTPAPTVPEPQPPAPAPTTPEPQRVAPAPEPATPAPATPSPAAPEAEAPAPVPEPAAPTAAAPEPAVPEPAASELAAPEAAPPPVPEVPAAPEPEAVVEAAPEPEPSMPPAAPEPETAPAPVALPTAAAPAPEPVPEPSPERAAAPSPARVAPAPAPSPRPAPMSAVRSYQAGTCADCKPGEAAVSAVRFAAAAGGACPSGSEGAAKTAVGLFESGGAPALASYSGPLFVGPVGGERVPTLGSEEVLAEVERLLAPWVDPASNCQLALVVLERGVKFTGYRYEARDSTGASDCLAGQECPLGDARWGAHPTVERTSGATFIWALFENRSSERVRRGELTVYFDPTP